jgi:hypothetical protein
MRILALIVLAALVPTLANALDGKLLWYEVTLGGQTLTKQQIPMDSAEACQNALKSVLVGPYSAFNNPDADSTFTAGCK